MHQDINIKKVRLNCYRQSKVPGEFMLQMRVPGGTVDAKYLSYVEHISKTWGDGNFHFGTRQTFDITGIKYENIPAVNEYLEQYIKEVDAELCGVNMDTVAHEPQPWDPKAGYPTIGARNITACVGTYHCICGNCNTDVYKRQGLRGDIAVFHPDLILHCPCIFCFFHEIIPLFSLLIMFIMFSRPCLIPAIPVSASESSSHNGIPETPECI